jgi:hypothetical protein
MHGMPHESIPPLPVYQRRQYRSSPNSRFWQSEAERTKPPPRVEEQIPLPLPKNLLLLTLMEAAELESVEKRNRRADGMILAFSYSEETDDDSSSDDGERVAADIAAISSTCGT